MTAAREALVAALVKGLGPWVTVAGNAWECDHYSIHQRWPHNDGRFTATVYRGPLVGLVKLGQHSTLAAAQAAAEADYRARIAAALDLDKLAALVELINEPVATHRDEDWLARRRAALAIFRGDAE